MTGKRKPIEHTLGQKLKFYRIRSGLSQFELETHADLASGTIAKIETGQTEPRTKTLVKIVNALDLTRDEAVYLIGVNVYAIRNTT